MSVDFLLGILIALLILLIFYMIKIYTKAYIYRMRRRGEICPCPTIKRPPCQEKKEGMIPELGIGSYDGPDEEDVDSYLEYTKRVALEPSVFEQQRDYTNQMIQKVSTASSNIERDDENLPNPRWGLPRWGQYRMAIPMEGARQLPTEDPEQMPEARPFVIY